MTKQYPSDDKMLFLISDDVREETGGKVTVLGLSVATELIVPKQDHQNAAIASMAFLFGITDGEGVFKSEFSIIDPDNQAVLKGNALASEVEKLPGRNANLVFKLIPFKYKLGPYRVILKLDDRAYERKFKIREP
ncbi:MAG: hypothetical protein HY525_09040 [Betaproteobacteria bacterium]|nr:hypothetical protein [Betaproteobacteria bacterium]